MTPEQARAEIQRRQARRAPVIAAPPRALADRPSLARGWAQSAAQGTAFGFGDEIAAGTTALLSQLSPAGRAQGIGGVYGDTLEAEHAEMARNQQAMGTPARLAAEIGGWALSGGALFRALGRIPALATPAQTVNRMRLAAAGEGALAGAGASDENRGTGAAVGAVTGLATLGLTNKIGRMMGARLPQDTSRVPQAAGRGIADRANRLGLRLTAGDVTGNRTAKLAQSATQRSAWSASAFEGMTEQNKRRANQLVLQRFRRGGTRVDGDVLDSIRKEIGNEFDSIGKQIAPLVQPTQHVDDALRNARAVLVDVEKPGRLAAHIEKIEELVTKPQGAPAQQVMVRLSELRRSMTNAARAGHVVDADALQDLHEAMLDSAMANNPQIAGDLAAVRRAWRDLSLFDKPAVVDAVTGQVNPVTLAGELGRSKYTRGVFTRTLETDNPIMELGRLVRQLGDTIGDPGQPFGILRGSFTPEGLSLSAGGIAAAPFQMAIAAGQASGGLAVTRGTELAQRIAPRLAALEMSR